MHKRWVNKILVADVKDDDKPPVSGNSTERASEKS